MANGWIALHRQIQENAIWTSNEPFDSRSAWIDLILSANHEDKEIYINGHFKMIQRGQFHTSQVKLAARWHWKRDKVDIFLKELKKMNMIDYVTSKSGETRGTTITIVKYSEFQNIPATKWTSKRTSEPQQVGQQSNINSGINNNINNDNNDKQEREEPELAPIKTFRFKTGRWENVLLSNDEAAKLTKEFGEAEARKMIDKLSDELATKENRYRQDGHYALICKWLREDKDKPQYKPKQKQADAENRTYTDADYLAMERKKLGIGGQNG